MKNNPGNDRVVPSAPVNAPMSMDAGTILTIITNEEATQHGVPLVIGDAANPSVGDLSNQRSMIMKVRGISGVSRRS